MNDYLRHKGNGNFEVLLSPLPEIIDFHVHVGLTAFFPLLKCKIHDENAGPPLFLGTSNQKTFDDKKFYHNDFPNFPSLRYFTYSFSYLFKMYGFFPTCTIPNLLKYMEEYNVKKAVIQIIDSPKLNQCEEIINATSERDNLISFCYVDPRDQRAEEKLKEFKDSGAKGLKFHPIASKTIASHPRAMKLFDACEKLGLPVLAHSGRGPVKKGFGEDPSRMKHFEPVFSTFPDLKFILAHIGSLEFKEAINFAEKYDNVYLETSESPAFVIREAAERLAGEKIFFGTDYSFNHPAVPLSIILDATRKKDDYREKILFKNAEKFIQENLER